MARKQNKPSRYIRMVELEKERPRAGTKRDISHLEVRIAVQESCFPHPEGTARQEIGSAKPAYCIQSPALSMSESCCCGLLFQGCTLLGHSVGIKSGDLRRPVLSPALDQLFQVFACVHDMPPNGLGGGLRVPHPAYFEQLPVRFAGTI